MRRVGRGASWLFPGVEAEPTQHVLCIRITVHAHHMHSLGATFGLLQHPGGVLRGEQGGARPYVTLGEEWKDDNFCILPSPTARRHLDSENAGLAKWGECGAAEPQLLPSRRNRFKPYNAGRETAPGNENTHSWALEEKRGRDWKEEGDGESRRRGTLTLPQSSIYPPDWWGEDRRESRDPGPSPSQHP